MHTNNHEILLTAIIFLAAAVVAVPLFKRFGFASVLGYLAAGSAIGPSGWQVVKDVQATMTLAEFGVVMLLFVIGLELKPSRLWVLRKPVFAVGGAQVGITTVLLTLGGWVAGLPPAAAFIVGASLAFSSTAFALQILAERRELSTQYGRSAFGILLFQDLAAIPLIAAIPLFAHESDAQTSNPWFTTLKIVGVIAAIIFGGRTLLRPAFRAMASSRTNEIFTAAALLLVLGVSFLMESIGLSMALGSFLAGVLLADSEYRHELEADIEPFKGLLLGLFFMSVGMTVDYRLLVAEPLLIAGLTFGLLGTKIVVNYVLGRVSGLPRDATRSLAVLLPQGGEFAFVVFAAAITHGVLSAERASLLVVVVTLSMALTPLLVIFNDRVLAKVFGKTKKPYDKMVNEKNEIIIAGFGRFGQIVGRTLRVMEIGFTALEADPNQVEVLRKFGNPVFYGDASKIDLLRAAGAGDARLFVLAIDDMEASLKTAEILTQHFPHLKIFARARNRQHAYKLLDLGIDSIWRETFGSSVDMTEVILTQFGIDSVQARRMMNKFRVHDEQMLREQHKVHGDEKKLIDASKESARLLSEILRVDRLENDDFRPREL